MVRAVRPLNLFMVGMTMMIFWSFLINPIFSDFDIYYRLDSSLFTVLLIMVMAITAGGYVINDVLDVETDRVNKPDKALSQTKDIKAARITYAIINGFAFIAALFIAIRLSDFEILAWCAGCILLLWAYSRFLKSTVLLGNVVVSMLIALVPFMFLIAEDDAFQTLKASHPDSYSQVVGVILSFSIFAFLSNLVREIVKDCEDYDGDRKAKLLTIATALGYKKADLFSQSLTVILFVSALIWCWLKVLLSKPLELAAFIFLVLAPILYLFYVLTRQDRSKAKYTAASKQAKVLMALGLVYLVFHLYQNYYA